jgi:hypothetical protein
LGGLRWTRGRQAPWARSERAPWPDSNTLGDWTDVLDGDTALEPVDAATEVVAEGLEGLEHFAKVGGGRHGWLVGL